MTMGIARKPIQLNMPPIHHPKTLRNPSRCILSMAKISGGIFPIAHQCSIRFLEVATVPTVQRVDEATPNGGDYSEIVYMNDSGDVVDVSVATKCAIRECAADGSLICETFGMLS